MILDSYRKMSINPSALFQLVLLTGCRYVFRPSDCLVLNAISGQKFSPNENAEFECIIDPYTNSQTWFVDSVSVADCGISTCSVNVSNPARYSFTPDTSAGKFIFKIDPISLEDDNNVIRCFDGTTFQETSISVTVRSSPTENPCWCWFEKIGWCIFIIILVIVVGLALLCYIPAAVIYLSNEILQGLNYQNRRLFIPFFGLYFIIVYYKVKPRTPKKFTYDISSVTINSFKVRWEPASNGKSGLKFLLVWSTGNGQETHRYISYQNNNDMEYVIRDLIKDTIYYVKICAEIDGVKSEFTENLTVITLEDKLREFRKEHKKIAEDKLREFRKEHKKIADACEDEICCGNCKKTGASHASHAYGLSHELYLCLDCLEKEHKDEAFGILLNTDKDKICCGKCKRTEASHASTVYCLSHQFYLCSDCLEKEHKDEECVLLNTGNLFYCNFCQPKKQTPVVCYDLKTVKLRCWKCYILNIQPSTKLSYPDEVTRELHRNSQMQKFPCRVHEDDTMSPTQANVYCLVCKSNMCDSCFKKHIIKKQNKLKPMSR